MNTFAKLLSILGLDGEGAPADWDGLTDEVLSTAIAALATTADVKAAHALIAEAYAEAKGALGAEPTAAAVAEAARVAQVAEMVRADHVARVEAAAAAGGLPDIDALPDDEVKGDAPTDADDKAKEDEPPAPPAPPADEVKGNLKVGGTAPPKTNDSNVDELRPIVTAQFTDEAGETLPMGQIDVADEGKVLLAAASTRGEKVYAVKVPFRETSGVTSPLAAALVDCGVVATTCEFPILVDDQPICGTADRPEAGAFVAAPAGWTGNQTVVFRPPIRVNLTDANVWNETNYMNLFVDSDDDGIPDMPLVFKDGVALSEAMKQCLKWECQNAFGWGSEADYVCMDAIPVNASPSQLAAYRSILMMQLMRARSRRTLSFIASNAKWNNQIAAPYALDERNRLAVVVDNVVTAISRLRANGKIAGAVDAWFPSWITAYMTGENFVRDTPFAQGEFAVLVQALASVNATPRLSYDGFDTTVASQLAAVGASDWYLAEPQTTGVAIASIAAAPPLAPLPNKIPVLITEAGSVHEESRNLVSVGFTGDITAQPLGKDELLTNCRTMFAEDNVFRAIRGCYEPIGLVICSDPRGATYDNVPLPDSSCAAPAPLVKKADLSEAVAEAVEKAA